ncbi:hypothetical protein DFH07DRAFT_1066201 [Mycena maculata]|uniref:Uncharacterized protein n=1 Tax=Mycena maculata TaxID=230809 RepID=A0AAD7HW76_9AGAR|nr:hypothetical protein DFH07DRAFT_1066201 [Mycena maculata]
MRRRRVLKLFLVPALVLLFFIVLSTLPPRQNLPLDAALDEALKPFLDQLPSSPRIRAIQKSLTSAGPPKSPRDFHIPEKYTPHVAQACAALRTKRILLVGPETTFYIHSLWLHALETHEHRTHDCPGPESCNFHHICLPPEYPIPKDRYKRPPKDKELVVSDSAVMRYVLSASLYTAHDKNDWGYTQPVTDPTTGIRLKNAHWLYQARKADIVLMNRGPIPAPAWTFAGHRTYGNWSFTKELPRHLGPGRSLAMEVVNAAFDATVTRFIPEVLQSLHTLQNDPSIRTKLLLWHASWFSGFIELKNFHSTRVDDPWALYYNAQVYMQNYLLNILLPHHGVYFLPRMAPSHILEDNSRREPGPKDTLRFPLGTPNAQAMETVFLKSLIEVLERVK